jgi:hypothetical protein
MGPRFGRIKALRPKTYCLFVVRLHQFGSKSMRSVTRISMRRFGIRGLKSSALSADHPVLCLPNRSRPRKSSPLSSDRDQQRRDMPGLEGAHLQMGIPPWLPASFPGHGVSRRSTEQPESTRSSATSRRWKKRRRHGEIIWRSLDQERLEGRGKRNPARRVERHRRAGW